MFILFLFFFFNFCFYITDGLIFYFDTETNILDNVSSLQSKNNQSLFVFLPGTSSICENYSELFNTINLYLNILCLNYPSDINISMKYYQKKSFLDRSKLLEKSLEKSVKMIYKKTNLNYLKKTNILNWNKIRASGHSQGGVLSLAWAKKHKLERLIMFSSPGCQFGKRLHYWIKKPFATKIVNIYGVESLQDSILPWYYGNVFFYCKKNDGIYNYIQEIGLSKNIQEINLFNHINKIKKKTKIILLNIPLLNGIISHLITCFNIQINNYLPYKNEKKMNLNREKIWKHVILD